MKSYFLSPFSGLSLVCFCLMAGIFISCDSAERQKKQIKELEAAYSQAADPSKPGEPEALAKATSALASAYEAFGNKYGQDSLAVGYLYRAAELYEANLAEPNKAIALFEKVNKTYQNSDKAADALFKIGFIYNNTFGDTAKAKAAYSEFLQKYPNHDMRGSAEFEINHLGMTPEQILQEIQEKNQRDTTSQDSTIL